MNGENNTETVRKILEKQKNIDTHQSIILFCYTMSKYAYLKKFYLGEIKDE
jgi:hypothetical protein